MTEQTLARARAGDEDAFRELTDPYRRELQLHVYRIVGSVQDAEDLLQETLLAAWRGLEQFEGRASLRAWLYRIATNRSLDALRASRRRPEDLPRMTERPSRPARPSRLARALPRRPSRGHPGRRSRARRRATRPRRRSRWRSSPAFSTSRRSSAPCSCCATCSASAPQRSPTMLDTTEPSVNSLLRRARAAFETRLPAAGRERAPLPSSKLERDIVGRFADAVRGGRHRRHRRPAHRRRLADDAARAATSTRAPTRSARSCATARPAAARRCGSCRRAPTASRPSAATSSRPDGYRAAVRAARPHARGRRGSPRSPGSPTAASSRCSDCHGCCGRKGATRTSPASSGCSRPVATSSSSRALPASSRRSGPTSRRPATSSARTAPTRSRTAATGHALCFCTWQSLVREQGLSQRDAV